jgi:chromosome partition protein MukE
VTRPGFSQLQDVLMDAEFPALDVALRRGQHVDRDDAAWYLLLTDAQELLETFYRRYGCELIHKTDGYFYLLPTSDRLPRRQLSVGDMLVGQALALLYLDPASVEHGGLVTREQLVAHLAAVLGTDALIRAFNPKRRRYDERVAQKTVRNKVAEAVRRLAGLGFVDMVGEEQLRLRPALLRFAEPVRGMSAPAEALARLVSSGEVAMAEEGGGEAEVDGEDGEELDEDTEADEEPDSEAEGDVDDAPPPRAPAAAAAAVTAVAVAPIAAVAVVPAAPPVAAEVPTIVRRDEADDESGEPDDELSAVERAADALAERMAYLDDLDDEEEDPA